MKLHRSIWLTLILSLTVTVAYAQALTCPAFVEQALTVVGDACADLGNNEICYGHNLTAVYDAQQTAIAGFTDPGDLIPVFDVQKLETSAFDVEKSEWGLAIMSLQAELPDTLPGQNIIVLVYGAIELSTDIPTGEDSEPVTAIQFSSGIGQSTCEDVPEDGILIQTPQDTTIQFLINGVEIEMGSTGVFSNTAAGNLRVGTLDGLITVTADGVSQQVLPGFEVEAAVNLAPGEPTPFDNDAISAIPISLLPQSVQIPINVPANVAWFDSGITLTSGDTYTLTASGTVNACADCEDHPLSGPEGITEWGTPNDLGMAGDLVPPLPDVTVASLIGRIGENGEAFYIGSGGEFTATANGTLRLQINDAPIGNESGSFQIVVNVTDQGES